MIIAAVDIGGTWIRVSICSSDLNEKNIKIKTVRTPKDHKFAISNAICKLLQELMEENDINTKDMVGIGLASAGPLDMRNGEVFNNANLGFKTIPLKKPIADTFPGIPINLINDCNAAVLGIHYFEANENEKDNLVYITMSTGIGGGVICNGHLLLGKEGNAAEIGHGLVEPRSKLQCNCGAYGCWEVYSSGTGVENRALSMIESEKLNANVLMEIVNNDTSKITAKEVFEAARKADELSKKIVQDCVFYSKVGIGLVNNFYDCSSIYFGGAMMKDKDQILDPIIAQFEKDPIQFTINHPPEMKMTRLGDEVGLRGALALIKYKLENSPLVAAL
ncbi:MAG: ROK family protein [Candidatus Lokiarchaeota archaeon]|nr:ROK family protein [Candidatus Lokiarchaeota archaeon]MBD3340318.1 ROK family protein [Candidatus Lokiarchaeota archaeon]